MNTNEKIENLEKEVWYCRAEISRLKSVMEAVASLPGKDWLIGQLALGEALDGKTGKHLDVVTENYEVFKMRESIGG
jgi:hypothetical protein